MGASLAGFMPLERRDELGLVPPDVAQNLTPCFERGPRPALRANVALASGVLVVVPVAATPGKFTAINAVLQAIRSARLPSFVCDALTSLDDVSYWAKALPESSGSTRVMITGPRATRWIDGEKVSRRMVTAIGMTD